jgi:serine/threonine protein kinase
MKLIPRVAHLHPGELFNYIVDNDGIKEHEAKFLFYQILRGVKVTSDFEISKAYNDQYLHERNITHRDLKPENLLLESPQPFSRVIITDFGMAKMLDTSLDRMRTRCGTLDYLVMPYYRDLTGLNRPLKF